MVNLVLHAIKKSNKMGIPYKRITHQVYGRRTLINIGSKEVYIIADWMEAGMGVPQTTVMVNEHRTNMGLPHVGKTCV